jgi:ribosome-binding protein aMBF1 (putative translation factor)
MEKPELNKKFDKQFGEYVFKKRTERGWSQADLSGKIGNNYQNVSRLERGEITPTLFWCYKLADAFEMDLADVIKEFGYKTKK